jgi:hypothetical protein
LAYEFNGDFDLNLFQQSLKILISRHDALRTVFVDVGGQIYQKVENADQADISFIDISEQSPDIASRRIDAIIEAANLHEFEPFATQPFLCKVIRKAKHQHIVIFNFFHMVVDGSALAIINRELSEIYNQLTQNRPVDSEPVRWAVLSEFESRGAIGVKKSISTKDQERILSHMASLPKQLNWVIGKGTKRRVDFGRGFASSELDVALSSQLTSFCEYTGFTRHTFMLSVLSIWAAALSKSDNILISDIISTRDKLDLQKAVRLCLGYLFLGNKVKSDSSFFDLANETQAKFFEAYQTQNSSDLLFLNSNEAKNKMPLGVFQFVFNLLL